MKFGSKGIMNRAIQPTPEGWECGSSIARANSDSGQSATQLIARNRHSKPEFVDSGLKIGIVGLGYWGRRQLEAFGSSTLVGECVVWDQNSDQVMNAVQQNEATIAASSLENCLDTVDAVVIATPAATHFEIAQEVVIRRVPVLVEKPLCDTIADAQLLIEMANDHGCFLQVALQYGFNDAIEKISEIIDRGLLGHPVKFTSNRIGGIPRDDVDVLMDFAIHDISIAAQIFGTVPVSIHLDEVQFAKSGQVGSFRIALSYSSGDSFGIKSAWVGPRTRMLRAEGPNGVLIFDETLSPERQLLLFTSVGGSVEFQPGHDSPLEIQATHFLEQLAIDPRERTGVTSNHTIILETISKINAKFYPAVLKQSTLVS